MDQSINTNSVNHTDQTSLPPKINPPQPKNRNWLWWIMALTVAATGLLLWQNTSKIKDGDQPKKVKFDKASIKPVASKNLEEMVVPEGFPKNFPFDKLAEQKVSLNQTDTYTGSIVSERASQTVKSPGEAIKILEQFFTEIKWQYQLDVGNSETSQTIIAFDGLGGSMTITAKLDSATTQTSLSFYANKIISTK